ncbi:radical SAM protein [Flavivirga spongiicola]|uniref:Radical SAM protein n=1 Tax=Flavivirga spongiicola TaxID=421621 RepID=A0ABU7XPK1_9FLAO|nr:radical SAM protein [Flavivirga sp. MEBiC05379]MDO5977709.1 radical SAM protein [Flavivirga sp. MEBiC05379]
MVNYLEQINKLMLPGNYLFPPKWIVLGVNNVCNLHCKMCDVGTKNLESNFAQNLVGTHPINMPKELIERIIDQVALFYPKTKLGYGFTEPLVYPLLIESLRYANTKNLFTSITTNALTLKYKAKELVDTNLNELYISLDGPQDIHNEIRGHKKSFQKAIEGIEELLKYGKPPTISVFCVITEWNIGYLNEFANFFKEYPLKQLGFMHTNFTPPEIASLHNQKWKDSYPATDSNVDEINIDNMDLELLWDEINDIKSSSFNFPINFSPSINSKEQLLTFYKNPEKQIGKKCNDIFNNIMIKSDGSVIPAHGRCYNLDIGNIYDKNIKDIWHSSILSKFRTDLQKAGGLFPACSRCCSIA